MYKMYHLSKTYSMTNNKPMKYSCSVTKLNIFREMWQVTANIMRETGGIVIIPFRNSC